MQGEDTKPTLSVSYFHRLYDGTAPEPDFGSPTFLRSNAIGNLWALSYEARKTLVFDIAYNQGVTATSTQHEVLVGFTYLLPHRLWAE